MKWRAGRFRKYCFFFLGVYVKLDADAGLPSAPAEYDRPYDIRGLDVPAAVGRHRMMMMRRYQMITLRLRSHG